ncbi:putative Na+/H+ antiporter [Pseudobdellovibrio exovorus]|uniref:Na+/H+ antiporter n=1 Tax=Pseudobdellovibrio exovorus JSS TaxID=1184267 RepID=M4V8C5_9BACT|nr:hypothetical protein A11Q_1426 [Pseudobdellovibrio exovorus JSS]
MEMTTLGTVATICFFCALVQSLFSGFILKLSDDLKSKRPYVSRFLHFAGEPEIVFGMWAAAFLAVLMLVSGFEAGLKWVDERNFSEVAFVVVIMVLASTRPITEFAEKIIGSIAKLLPLSKPEAMYIAVLIIGPLLGSLITEPAAMTISALLLKRRVFDPLGKGVASKFFYITLATLFVNISVGGALTHFAAPPVLMVARIWDWDTPFMFMTFGWKAVIAVVINTIIAFMLNRETLKTIKPPVRDPNDIPLRTPFWITAVHLAFMVLCVMSVHHPTFVIGLFMFFLGFYDITRDKQSEVRIEESMLVGFFLAGLVTLTAKQGWWLKPILQSIENLALYVGTLILSPITDNAAMTSLAAQVSGLSDQSKYLIVAAAIVGGGMTIIANAPNPAGLSLLKDHMPGKSLSAGKLLMGALTPTIITALLFWFL